MSTLSITSETWSDPVTISGKTLVSCVQNDCRVTTETTPTDLMDGVYLKAPNDSLVFADGATVRFRRVHDGDAKVSFTQVA